MSFPDLVIVLPGISGSVLSKDGQEIWGTSSGAMWRALTSGGDSIKSLTVGALDDPTLDDLGDGVTAPSLISDLHLVPGLWKIDGYSGLIERLQKDLGLETGKNLFPFPYDWRRDNSVAARKLKTSSTDWLKAWRDQSGNKDAKLILVAHSMGGLVARYFLEVLEGWRDARGLISFGTPYRGSLNALGYLANGFSKGIGPLKVDLSSVLASFTSVYQLMPAFECIDTGTGALKTIADSDGIRGVDATRAKAAFDFYQRIKTAEATNADIAAYKASPYGTYPIVGLKQPTFQSALIADGRVTLLQTLRGQDNDGDGTVPRISATPYSMSKDHREIYVAEAHASLQNFDPALVNLVGILTGEQIDLSRFAAEALSVDIDDAYAAGPVTIRATPTVPGDLVVRIVSTKDGKIESHAMQPFGTEGGYAATISLPVGLYRAEVEAMLSGAPIRVTDVFAVVDGGASGPNSIAAAPLRRKEPRARKPKAKAAAIAKGAPELPATTPQAVPSLSPTPAVAPPSAPTVPASSASAPVPLLPPISSSEASASPFPDAPSHDQALTTVRITVVSGGLTNVVTPVAVTARYDSLALKGSARAFDFLLDAWLTRAIDLGIAGSGLGALFPINLRHLKEIGKVKADNLWLADMGEPGTFAQDSLRFLISNIVVGVKSSGNDLFAINLLGTRRKELSVEDAVRACAYGIKDGFERFRAIAAAVKNDRQKFLAATARPLDIILIDPDKDKIGPILKALDVVGKGALEGLALDFTRGKDVDPDPDPDPNAFDVEPDVPTTLLRITRGKTPLLADRAGYEVFQFSALSERAAVPMREVDFNGYYARVLPQRMMGSRSRDEMERLGTFFSNCLFPEDFGTFIQSASNLVLELDETTAKFPWEMAAQRAFSRTSFHATSKGMSRQFRTLLSPPPTSAPPLNSVLKVLVIADPADGNCSLVGARAEGYAVVEVLGQARQALGAAYKIAVTVRIGPPSDPQGLSELDKCRERNPWLDSIAPCDPIDLSCLIVSEQFDVIHFSGHGFCERLLVRPNEPPLTRSGWVLAQDCRLTAKEIFRVRQVPRLVFANACFTAVMAEEGITGDNATADEQMTRSVALAQAYFARGIPNFIGTGWEVSDKTAPEFARWFYARVLGLATPDAEDGLIAMSPPATIGEAVREARERTLNLNPGSSTWGAYQHYGRVGDKLLPFRNTASPTHEARTSEAPASDGLAADGASAKAPSPSLSLQAEPVAAKQEASVPDLIYLNGIDAQTGQYAFPPISIDAVAKRVLMRPGLERFIDLHIDTPRSFGVTFATDPTKLGEAGWGVVFHEDTPQDIRQALEPLITHRQSQAKTRFKVLDFKKDEKIRSWYQRHNISAGSVDPEIVPYYLLLVGPPDLIPFEFQYLVGVEYAIGRLAFDTAGEYERYARSVVLYEASQAVPNAKEIAFWGTEHPGDPATTLSATTLIAPLANGTPDAEGALKRPISGDAGVAQTLRFADDATRANLLEMLHAKKPPAVLFTASHGMSVRNGQPTQLATQGALLCQDWTGLGTIRPEHLLTAADIDDSANVNGMIAFFFACFGAGTPVVDQFPMDLSQAGQMPSLAPKPFVAALPRRLLAHPKGSALAVIGHVDRAWGFSMQTAKTRGPQIGTFRNSLGLILAGQPVGHAISGNFGARYAALSTALATATAPGVPAAMQPSDRDLVTFWLERNDAQNYVVLGDPAVRVRADALQAV